VEEVEENVEQLEQQQLENQEMHQQREDLICE
jgi:hypothetical protein